MPTNNLFYFKVSSLSHFSICTERAKIETFNKLAKFSRVNGSMVYGTKFHHKYSYYNRDFDRDRIMALYGKLVVEKRIENIVVKGKLDDVRVYLYKGEKYVSIIEVKTTNKEYMTTGDIQAAIKQLQLYMWMYKEIIENLDYKLWKRGYVEIYSQQSGRLIKRLPVEFDLEIEQWIKLVVDTFKGFKRAKVPNISYCKYSCPVQVKKLCTYYQNKLRVKELEKRL